MYELFYSTGGHGGPYHSVEEAVKAAVNLIRGNRSEMWIDVREYGKVWRTERRIIKMADGMELETVLETLIDRNNLAALFEAIANVCHGKAEHLKANWQDSWGEKAWADVGIKTEKLSELAKKHWF